MVQCYFISTLLVITTNLIGSKGVIQQPPNIVLILADDLGWNDVSLHGSNEILTANIDALCYNGITLNSHYSESLCTPSRSALLTGKYPIHTGMQHNIILETEARGLPLKEKLLPQYFQQLGYLSHAVGKWHLGFYQKQYTPTFRGFHSFYGLWNGYHDYYKHNVQAWFTPFDGYDMRRNMNVDWSAVGKYSTDLFTDESVNIIRNHNKSIPLLLYLSHIAPHAATYEDPLQAPIQPPTKFPFIKQQQRRKYAAMVSKLDESVGKIVDSLQENNMLNNSIIVFVSDNGAPTTGIMRNYGSNWPFKGEKSTPWEGGIRTVGCVWSTHLINQTRVDNNLMHISDWLPTLFHAAGGDVNELKDIDGVNMWPSLSSGSKASRNGILHNIDDVQPYEAIRINQFKYVNGTSMFGYLDHWVGETIENMNNSSYYDTQEIVESNVGKQLSKYRKSPLTSDKIISLRQEAQINCSIQEDKKYSPCNARKTPCIFNVQLDPCERNNLYDNIEKEEQMKIVWKDIERELENYRKTVVKHKRIIIDMEVYKLANPAFYNNTWVNWYDYVAVQNDSSHSDNNNNKQDNDLHNSGRVNFVKTLDITITIIITIVITSIHNNI